MRCQGFSVLVLGVLLPFAGCGGDTGDLPAALPAAGEADAAPAYDPATAAASVSGAIFLEGPVPDMPFLDMGSDFYCQRAGVGLRSEEVSVTDDGALRNVIVYVRSGYDPSLTYPVPADPVVLDQERCVYRPRTLTLMTGQPLLVRNSDSTLHNVHAEAGGQTFFNFAQRSGPREDTEVFSEPAVPVHIGCDLHRWMDTYLGVFDHPFHTTSGDTGRFALALPPGSYQIVAWHERYGEQVVSVDLAAGESADVDFRFGESPE